MERHESNGQWLTQAARALGFISPHKGLLTAISSLTLLVAVLGALEPLAMKYIFDKLGTGVFTGLAVGIAMLIGLNLAREAFGGLSNWLAWKIRLDVNQGLLEATVTRLHHLPMTYHREETVGGIMTKLDRGVNGFVSAISDIAFNVFPSVVYLVISLVIMFNLDTTLSFIVLFFAPLPAIIGMWAADEQTRRERALVDRWTRIFSRFNEVLTGILTVKSFAAEDSEKERFMSGVHGANRMVLRGVGVDTGVGAAKNLIGILAKVCALAVGGYLVIKQEITAGTLIAFLGYASGLFGPVQGLTGVYQTIRKASVSLGIIFSIIDAHDHMSDAPHAKPVKAISGEVVFEGVSFAYNQTRPVLNGIDLFVSPGECVALVGPSGAGKSTIAALLQRLHDPTSGSIRIDGVDLKDMKQRSLRERIGVVSQDALLFNDTVKNNIAYGKPNAGTDEITAAGKAANAHDFIMRLPKGYDTMIGERGSLLSAGERQRLSIARALIKDPPILILDEATSSLDAESESFVQDALERVMQGRTTFIIAHRLSTVVGADRILVLKDGAIIETGSHSELLSGGGYYATLVECQSRGLIVAAA
ncbi:MAG: ABC transporter [Deltaproteobacteria bacterium GWA2_54_12]|nr:MAG: ABC transporter [Deltaproteobacteria bacterium GWA2_54_12]